MRSNRGYHHVRWSLLVILLVYGLRDSELEDELSGEMQSGFRLDTTNLKKRSGNATSSAQVFLLPKGAIQRLFGTPVSLIEQSWLAMSFEVEFFRKATNEEGIDREVDLHTSAKLVQAAIDQTSIELPNINGSHYSTGLHRIRIKEAHNDQDDYAAWNWEYEPFEEGMLELSSPGMMNERDTLFALGTIKRLQPYFIGRKATTSLHIHVDSRCLLHDERRLASLLLIWENYHDSIFGLIKCTPSQCPHIHVWARSLSQALPELIPILQRRWLSRPDEACESIETSFLKTRELMRPTYLTKSKRDGFRTFAVNVCHLLNIPCCIDCEKNLVRKFGGIEFRMFRTSFATALHLLAALCERLVQKSCTAPLGDLDPFMKLPGAPPPKDAAPLLQFLGFDPDEFMKAVSLEKANLDDQAY